MSNIETALLPATAATDEALLRHLVEIVNLAYRVAEAGMWRDDAPRVTIGEMAEFGRRAELLVARTGGRVVGCVRVRELEPSVWEFGMLAAGDDVRGRGVGRELVAAAEALAVTAGGHTMQLELLVPLKWTQPTKVTLDAWYRRLGYRPTHRGSIEVDYPRLAPMLATPCGYMIYRKPLPAASEGPAATTDDAAPTRRPVPD